MKAYLNGEFVEENEASVSVFDHGLLYGDGVFEGIRAYDGYVFKFKEHLDRLYDSAKAIELDIPLSREEMSEAILETLRVNEVDTAYIRPVVTRGVGDLGIDPTKCTQGASVIVIVKEWKSLYPEEVYQKGMSAAVVSTRVKSPESLPPSVKSLNYLANILARIEANHLGVDEGIMLDPNGFVAEGTADNLFLVKDGALYTPPVVSNLPGITRASVIDVAQDAGYEVEEQFFGAAQLYTADEMFLTGTAAEIAPIVTVNKRPIGDGTPGPITHDLRERFMAITGQPDTGTPIG